MDRPGLRDILVTHFSDGELRDLCFDLGIDYESLPGEGKSAKARELVAYCQRRDRLAELEAAKYLRDAGSAKGSEVSDQQAVAFEFDRRPSCGPAAGCSMR